MYEVVIEENAALEIEEIYNWYEDKSAGLGERFKDDFDKRIKILFLNPYTFMLV